MFSIKSVTLLCAILLGDLINCHGSLPPIITSEQPINETVKTIEIKIVQNTIVPSLTITCLNYDALKDLDRSILNQINWTTQHGKWIFFKNCFNNETSHDNYKNFNLENFLRTGPSESWSEIDITFHQFAIVDPKIFFKNFKFDQYKIIKLYNIGFETTTFLSKVISNAEVKFGKCNSLDFNHFTNNTISLFQSTGNLLLNFDSTNLGKFAKLTELQLYYSNFDNDMNVFNVPRFFSFNPTLRRISIESSVTKLVLHENVFAGLYDLELISLARNQIEHISENQFRELHNVAQIILDGNLITNLHENTFAHNPKLSYLSLDRNELLKFSETSSSNFNFATPQLSLSLEDVAPMTTNQYKHILNHPNINRLQLSQLNLNELNLDDPILPTNRSQQIVVTLNAGSTYFNVPTMLAENLTKPVTEYGTIIRIIVHTQSKMCNSCSFIKQVLFSDADVVYAQDNHLNIAFEFILLPDCRNFGMMEPFYHQYDLNCASPCLCKYNELIEKIKIDCTDKNLTEIPILLYPSQFDNIDSIDLLFMNNMLSTVNFVNQSALVMEKLSTFNFFNNSIETVNLMSNPPKNIHYFIICENPLLKDSNLSVAIPTVDGVEQIDETNCLIGTKYNGDLKTNVQHKSESRVKELLDNCV